MLSIKTYLGLPTVLLDLWMHTGKVSLANRLLGSIKNITDIEFYRIIWSQRASEIFRLLSDIMLLVLIFVITCRSTTGPAAAALRGVEQSP